MQEPNMNEHAYARAVLAEQLSTFATEAGMQVPAKFIENKLANMNKCDSSSSGSRSHSLRNSVEVSPQVVDS